MSRIILMALVLAATVVGCDRFPDLTIQITDNLAPNDPPECGYEVEQEEILFRGFWDLAITADYYMFPRIESYIIDNSLPTQAPPGNMTITSYNVTVKLPDNSVLDLGESLPNPYQVTTNAVIPASQVLGEISRGIAGALMIPASYQSAIAGAAAALRSESRADDSGWRKRAAHSLPGTCGDGRGIRVFRVHHRGMMAVAWCRSGNGRVENVSPGAVDVSRTPGVADHK